MSCRIVGPKNVLKMKEIVMSRNNHIKKVFHAELSGEIIKKVLKMSVKAEKPELEDIGGKGSEKRC